MKAPCPPAWRFSLPDTVVKQQCGGIIESEGRELGRAEVAAGRDPGPDPRHGRIGSV
jgi:hypothetical protein